MGQKQSSKTMVNSPDNPDNPDNPNNPDNPDTAKATMTTNNNPGSATKSTATNATTNAKKTATESPSGTSTTANAVGRASTTNPKAKTLSTSYSKLRQRSRKDKKIDTVEANQEQSNKKRKGTKAASKPTKKAKVTKDKQAAAKEPTKKLSKGMSKEISMIKETADEIHKFLEEQKKVEKDNKAKAIAFCEKKRAKRDRRKKQRAEKGVNLDRKHPNKLLDESPPRGFWEHSCCASDVSEWLYKYPSEKTLPDSILKQMEELEEDEEKKGRAKYWRAIGEPLFKELHPKLFD